LHAFGEFDTQNGFTRTAGNQNLSAIAEYTHSAVAAFVASNMADVGFGVETAARRFDLDFIPLARENYIFACKNSALKQSLLKSVCSIMQSVAFRHAVDTLAGYDGTQSGELVSFEETFAVNPE
jgi:molybdate-binding protein